VVKVSIFFLELTALVFVFVFVFEVFADLAAFFSFFKGVSVDTGLLNRIDFSLLRNLEIIVKNISNSISFSVFYIIKFQEEIITKQ
jgi:hypothetical protein